MRRLHSSFECETKQKSSCSRIDGCFFLPIEEKYRLSLFGVVVRFKFLHIGWWYQIRHMSTKCTRLLSPTKHSNGGIYVINTIWNWNLYHGTKWNVALNCRVCAEMNDIKLFDESHFKHKRDENNAKMSCEIFFFKYRKCVSLGF